MKKRICFYAVATELGGAERSLIELVKGLKSESSLWEPVVLLPKKSGPLIEELNQISIETLIEEFPDQLLKASRKNIWSLFSLVWTMPKVFCYLQRVGRQLKENQVVILHTTGIKCHFFGALVGKFWGMPVVIHMRDILQPGLIQRLLEMVSTWNGIHFIANSRLTALPFSNRVKNIPVVYNGINPEDFSEKWNPKYSEHFKVAPDVPIIGIVGTFTEWKGQKEFIQAAKILTDRNVNARYVIVGARIYDTNAESNYEQELRSLVIQLNLEDRIYFPGFERNSSQIMNSIRVLVHASTKPEPFGRVLIEAMACGTLVVASRWGAASEILRNGEEGLLVDPRKPVEIADAVQELLGDEKKSDLMRQAAKRVVRERFTHQQYCKGMDTVFKRVVDV